MIIPDPKLGASPNHSWLESIGISLPVYFWPRGKKPRVRILLLTGSSPDETAKTIASLLTSTVQDFLVVFDNSAVVREDKVKSWLQSDDRFVLDPQILDEDGGSERTMILPAGIILTPYTIEALLETTLDPEVKVVRVSVNRCVRGVEFWKTDFLSEHTPKAAEDMARKLGAERWVNGEALGIHASSENAPKVFLRRGRADRHILDVVVYHSFSEMPTQRPIEELAALRREVARLRKILEHKSPRKATLSTIWLKLVEYSALRRFHLKK